MVVADMQRDLVAQVPGLAAVRHVHVWSITSGRPVATLKIVLDAGADPAAVTAGVKQALAERHGVQHATVEIAWGEGARDCALGAVG